MVIVSCEPFQMRSAGNELIARRLVLCRQHNPLRPAVISADDAKATYKKLTQYMNKVASDILKEIKDYEPGNKV